MDEYVARNTAKRRLAFAVGTGVSAVETIDQVPAADVVQVVRCKDCKHSTPPSELTQRYGVPGTLTCHNRHCPCNRRNVGGDDFCSYGKRKEEM